MPTTAKKGMVTGPEVDDAAVHIILIRAVLEIRTRPVKEIPTSWRIIPTRIPYPLNPITTNPS